MIGYAQGVQSIVDAVVNITQEVVRNTPNLNSPVAFVIAGYLERAANPNFGAYWEFGVLLAIVGFILVAIGDHKSASAQEAEPLLAPSPA